MKSRPATRKHGDGQPAVRGRGGHGRSRFVISDSQQSYSKVAHSFHQPHGTRHSSPALYLQRQHDDSSPSRPPTRAGFRDGRISVHQGLSGRPGRTLPRLWTDARRDRALAGHDPRRADRGEQTPGLRGARAAHVRGAVEHRGAAHASTSRRGIRGLSRSVVRSLCAMVLASCATNATTRRVETTTAPADLLGSFTDDYQGTYVITPTLWRHGTRLAYEIVAWHPDSQYLIARNAQTNPREGGLWTRIDWMPLDGMPPYTWAYCLSAFKAPTRDSAQATRVAQRATPRTGCNGFPFSRMRRVDGPATP